MSLTDASHRAGGIDVTGVVAAALGSRRVLVVEDRVELAVMFADALRAAGADVYLAHDGADALAVLRRHHVDILVADLRMPRLDGYELLRRLRGSSNGLLRTLPAIAITGEPDWSFQDPLAAARAGFDFHLVKPVMPQTLVDTVANVVRWRRRETPEAD